MRHDSGITLLEVLVAVTLLSFVSMGMMLAMRLGMSALSRTDARLMDNRRVSGAQRIIEQELQGMVPVVAPCGEVMDRIGMFAGDAQSLALVSDFSLQEAWRGRAQFLQMFTIPDDRGGFRLVVNETPYTGPEGIRRLCTQPVQDPETGYQIAHFAQPVPGPTTFVLADHLRTVRFQYLKRSLVPLQPETWVPVWRSANWPVAIRVDLVPSEPAPGRLQPISIVAPLYLYRDPKAKYEDQQN